MIKTANIFQIEMIERAEIILNVLSASDWQEHLLPYMLTPAQQSLHPNSSNTSGYTCNPVQKLTLAHMQMHIHSHFHSWHAR